VKEGEQVRPRHVGFCFMLPLDLKKSHGSKKCPITGLSSKPIGQIKGRYDKLLGKLKVAMMRYWAN